MKFQITNSFLFSKNALIIQAIVWALIIGAVVSRPDNRLHLIFCDVGQGDAVLITQGKNQILVDGGPNDKVLDCLTKHMPFWDKDLELIVVTHPESDHITGLVSVIERYNVRQILSNSLLTETGVFSSLRKEVIDKKIPVYSPQHGDKIKISKLELRVLFPMEKLGNEIVWKDPGNLQVLGVAAYNGNLNGTVIVSQLNYGSFKALLTGDIGEEQENEIRDELERVNVLKVAHHGSKYSSSKLFLEKTNPALAVISVGAKNRYGHPTSEVLDRLRELGIKFLRTDIDGEVEVVSDGVSWRRI